MNHLEKEIIRYLGYGANRPDETIKKLILECMEELKNTVRPRSLWRRFPLVFADEGNLCFAGMEAESWHLAKNLTNCGEVLLFAATLGAEADVLIKRYSKTDMAKAVVLQAAAAAMLEYYCDMRQKEIAEELRKEGKHLRPRFSPGYGDFSIEHQKHILLALECGKKIGLSMTDGFMLTPAKSITAVIGVAIGEENCPVEGCESCQKRDCAFRRDETLC